MCGHHDYFSLLVDQLMMGTFGVIVLILLAVFTYFIYSGLSHKIQTRRERPPIKSVRVADKNKEGSFKKLGFLFSEAGKCAGSK